MSKPYHDDFIPIDTTKIDDFVFLDSVHASGAAHKIISEAMILELGSFNFP